MLENKVLEYFINMMVQMGLIVCHMLLFLAV